MADIRDKKAVPFEEETKESILKEEVATFEKPAGLDEKVSILVACNKSSSQDSCSRYVHA